MAEKYRVISNEEIAKDIRWMKLEFGMGKEVLPGQFLHIQVPGRTDLILRRPISINDYDANSGIIEIVYQVKGEGTKAIQDVQAGDQLDVLGPLGNGFRPGEERNIWIVGGGLGVAPLKYLPKRYPNIQFEAILGFRNQESAYQLEEFFKRCKTVDVLTEDGSIGEEGFVTKALQRKLVEEKQPDAIYLCGPMPMIGAVKKVLRGNSVRALVSMEQRMGCGIGACEVCTCAIHKDGALQQQRVCLEGPVFDLWEVAEDDEL